MNKVFELNWYVGIFWIPWTKIPFTVIVSNNIKGDVEKIIFSEKEVAELLKWVDKGNVQIYEEGVEEIIVH